MTTCKDCGNEMKIDSNGIANHLDSDGNIDFDQDADHVALAKQTSERLIHIHGYDSKEALESEDYEHIDSLPDTEQHREKAHAIASDNINAFYHVSILDDNGKSVS